MGGWKLEVFKMVVYMSFPVATFWYFNQPEYFESWIIKMRRELYPPEDKLAHAEIKKAIEEHNKKQEEELLKFLQSAEKGGK